MQIWDFLNSAALSKQSTIWRYGIQTVAVGSTLGWMAFSFLFLGTSDPPTPDISPWWIGFGGHLFLFTVLGFLVSVSVAAITRSPKLGRYLIAVGLVGVSWGIFTELWQMTVPGRSASVEDLILDMAGSFFGGITAWAMGMWAVRKLSEPRPT